MTRLLLLLLLLLPAGSRAQSGDEDGDGDANTEPRISCTSDISKDGNNLTCQLLRQQSNDEDDEDEESDSIESMRLCYTDYSSDRLECEEAAGDRISFKASIFVDFNLTVHLKRGGSIRTSVDLKKIVKPKSPSVKNVTFNLDSNQAIIYIGSPYHSNYLKIENQLFQLNICTAGSDMTQNISASDNMKIDMKSIQRNSRYDVRVRAIPIYYLRGSWSEWSPTFSFDTPAEEKVPTSPDERQSGFILVVCVVSAAVAVVSAVFFCKHKICSYMWPSIPHPKHTLVQICQPNKGFLLIFTPEVFSALKVHPLERADEEPGEEEEPSVNVAAADRVQSNNPSSTQSSDCSSTTSTSTEELELSALLSRTCSDSEETSPIHTRQHGDGHPAESDRGQAEVFGVGPQEEAYVTMSSFYQIK